MEQNMNNKPRENKNSGQMDDSKETRTLLMRTINSLNSLDAAVKEINQKVNQKEQGEANRFYVTFVLLGIVIIFAFFFYFRAEVVKISEKHLLLQDHNSYLKKEVEELKEKLFSLENNDIKAYNLYLALKEGDPNHAFKLYGEFNLSALSRLERLIIDKETSLIKQKAAVQKYEEGEILFKRKSYEAAVDRFQESLEISSTGEHVSTLFYLTSLCHYRMKDYNKAAIAFERFLFINTQKGYQKDRAELLLGVCYEKLNQWERAKNFYIQSMKDNRYNRYYPTIRDRLKLIEKKLEKQKAAQE
ncbi:MAG: tetratricopeptide repeat protein [bacterium]